MFDDSTMLVYGGFSQRCEDYCDDLWSFDVRDGSWMEIYEVGKFGPGEAPGKRWRFSIVADGRRFYVFGGFRLWHGFAQDNSEDNRWSSTQYLPKGGYLSDLWVYEKRLLAREEPMPTSSEGLGTWTNLTGRASCELDPGDVWSQRNREDCKVAWPTARAGHTSALDAKGGGVYVFGGYATGVRSLHLGETTPARADSCSVGLQASPSFQRGRRKTQTHVISSAGTRRFSRTSRRTAPARVSARRRSPTPKGLFRFQTIPTI